MGMIQSYLRVDIETLNNFIADSSRLEDIVFEQNNTDNESFLDLDKAWEGIFFLITGQSLAEAVGEEAPLLGILMGPTEIDPDQDMGYGPATYITAEQTKEIYSAIKDLTKDELSANFDPSRMAEEGIYPDIWEDDENALEYLLDYLDDLKNFYKKAVENGEAVVMFLSPPKIGAGLGGLVPNNILRPPSSQIK